MTPLNATLGAAVAGIPELQTFLDTYPCQANTNGSYYFYFEPVSTIRYFRNRSVRSSLFLSFFVF